MKDDTSPSERTRLKRHPERGEYSREVIDSVLDEALICHLGFIDESGLVVIPTIHARVGDTLYVHGSPASRTLRRLSDAVEVCISVAIVDGIVAARSIFNHSMNYRSVVVFGTARLVEDREEKWTAFRAISDNVLPGRWDDARQPSEKEDRGTLILAVPLDEASAKVRSGPPDDDDEDVELPVWAGVIPLRLEAGEPIPDPQQLPGVEPPQYVTGYRRPTPADS